MDNTKEWWQVVEALSRYLSMGIDAASIFDEHIHQALTAEGYSQSSVDQAMEWLEEASLSCEVGEILALSQPVSNSVRIPSTLEEKCIPTRIERHIEKATESGILSRDHSEKLRETLLSLDAKEWTESDQMQFVIEILQSTLPNHDADSLRKFLQGKNNEFYC
jgi:uncharacterized protein Smg (DUF494 family)